MSIPRVLCAVVAIAGAASASGPPRLDDFPASGTFHGKPVAPVLATKEARTFRTELRRQAALGPNFARRYTLAVWGCGAGCVSGAVIDARSGQVWVIPFTWADAWEGDHIVCHHASDFALTSELLIVQGQVEPGGRRGKHYFRWHNSEFTPVYFDPACSI